MTVAGSDSAVPTARDEALTRAVPDADLWTSILRERDEDYEFWMHVYVTPRAGSRARSTRYCGWSLTTGPVTSSSRTTGCAG